MKLPYKQWKKLDEAMAFLDETVNAVPMGIQIEPEAPSLVQLSREMWELIDELKPEEKSFEVQLEEEGLLGRDYLTEEADK